MTISGMMVVLALVLAAQSESDERAEKVKEHQEVGRVLEYAIDRAKADLARGCAGDPAAQSEIARRAAALSEERAIRAMFLSERVDISELKIAYKNGSVDILIETAEFWILAWQCRREHTLYLEFADKALVTAGHLAQGDATRTARIDAIKATIARARNDVDAPAPPAQPAVTDRFSVRLEGGYSSGRLSRTPSAMSGSYYDDKGFRSHHGGYFSMAVMMRLPATTGRVNFLGGPYYTYWRGAERSAIPETSDAHVHEFGARLELAIVPHPWAIKYVTLHPAIEFGLQYVDFDKWNWSLTPGDFGPYQLDPSSVDMAGGTIGMSLGACFVHSSLCAAFRFSSVALAWRNAIPTLRGGVAVDVVRLAHAIINR